MDMDLEALNSFIVAAKSATYVGGGGRAASTRLGSHDIAYSDGAWSYRDSYFGGTDFLGQEVVWRGEEPIWAMNYYGYILRPDLIDSARAGSTIKGALSALYQERRFLGGYDWRGPHGVYQDRSTGDVAHFSGRETISVAAAVAYALDYSGGLVKR